MLHGKGNANEKLGAMAKSPGGLWMPAHAVGRWRIVARDPDGKIIRIDEWDNLVTTVGKNYLLGAIAAEDSPQTFYTDWYIGLTDGSPTTNAADTTASHAGWIEVVAYTGNRKLYQPAAPSSGSITNTANVASFAINADSTTIGGAFLANSDDYAESPQTGLLYAVGAFTGGDLVLNNGSTLDVTAVFSL